MDAGLTRAAAGMFSLVRRFPRPRLPSPRRSAAPRGAGEPATPGRPRFEAIADRVRNARYAVEDAAFGAARAPGAIGREVWEAWLDLSIYARRRLALGA